MKKMFITFLMSVVVFSFGVSFLSASHTTTTTTVINVSASVSMIHTDADDEPGGL